VPAGCRSRAERRGCYKQALVDPTRLNLVPVSAAVQSGRSLIFHLHRLRPTCPIVGTRRSAPNAFGATLGDIIDQRGTFMPVLSILVGVLVTFVVILLVLYLVNLLPIEGRLKQILRVVVIILGILSLVRYFGVGF